MKLRITNRDARRLYLHAQGLSPPTPRGTLDEAGLEAIVRQLGFVQIDTVRSLARAHDHILWTRHPGYREEMVWPLLESGRLFEHFTHDASLIPSEWFPHWRARFTRHKRIIETASYWRKVALKPSFIRQVKRRVAEEGALFTRDFESDRRSGLGGWNWSPHKFALEYLWRVGELATAKRHKFQKAYDLTERVIPAAIYARKYATKETVDWACHSALRRLAFGNEGEIKRFWDKLEIDEVKVWVARADVLEVQIDASDGGAAIRALAPADIEAQLRNTPCPSQRLRIVNPFDPLVRDRQRLKRLFGYDFRVEIFVPKAKRVYGYYVCPILEGDRFVGRIEVVAERKTARLRVQNLWLEKGVKCSAGRRRKLDAELARLARFVGMDEIIWVCRP